jgi:hypothetical protein
MYAAVLLMMLSAAGSPIFVIPQPDMDTCIANAVVMDRVLNGKVASAECWDQSTQAFRMRPHAQPPSDERID